MIFNNNRGGSRIAATSKMELLVITVNGFQPLTIITKCSILDVAAVLDPPLNYVVTITQKHSEMFLDTQEHLKNIFSKINKTISLLRKLHHMLPRSPLLTIYKSFIRAYLNYGDVIYDQTYNTTLVEHNFFQNSFFPSAVSNGTNWTEIFAIQKA